MPAATRTPGTAFASPSRMPRHPRCSPDGYVQHVINRGDHRETLFHKRSDFAAFIALMAETARRIPMRVLAYCIMKNHFHLLLWPHRGIELPEYMQVLMNLHIQRYLKHYPPASPGHIYQGRYRNVIVQNGHHVLTVARYIEANPLKAGIVERAEDYEWSSAWPHSEGIDRPVLEPGAIERSAAWRTFVNEPMSAETIQGLEHSIRKGLPIGSPEWKNRVVAQFGLQYVTREPGRPRVYDVMDL